MKTIDILCIGEVLIDFIGHEKNATILDTKNYHRFLGGSPTNVAVNAARLGLRSALVASCGKDGLGDYIINKLEEDKVVTSFIYRDSNLPTSIILVSKSEDTPDFTAYREADSCIPENLIDVDLLNASKIYHTTSFALSKNPARNTILKGAEIASELGLQLSIDLNYSEKIWPDREEAARIIGQYLKYNPLVKVSNDDCHRYFGAHLSEKEVFEHFHNLGANTICLTKGKNGVSISDKNVGVFHQEAIRIKEVHDATGAGDAFWTGFLYAQINEKTLEQSVTIAQKLATIKLQNVGRLPDMIGLKKIINDLD